MTSVSRQRAKRRRASLARARTPEHQYMALMSRLLCVELASSEDVHLAKRKLPDRSYYHLILAIGPAAQEVIGPLGYLKYVHEEFLLPEGAAMVFRTAHVFALAEMLAEESEDVAMWMTTPQELIPGQPRKTPLQMCVESEQGANFLANHLRRRLKIDQPRLHPDEEERQI